MASTDSPLKRLVSTFITDFAAWLLKTQVREARPLNIELPGETLAVDQVFRVVLVDGRQVILHIEFQGRRSHSTYAVADAGIHLTLGWDLPSGAVERRLLRWSWCWSG